MDLSDEMNEGSSDSTNYMLNDYNNPDLNAFEAGPALTEANQNRRIILKKVPFKLQRHAILNLLQTFGTVVDLNIPANQETFKQYQPGFLIAFAEFSQFNEAEKAMREINHSTNKGFSIRAEFAHDRRKVEEENVAEVEPKLEHSGVENEWEDHPAPVEPRKVVHPLPLTVAFDVEPNDVYERVSAFHRKETPMNYKTGKQMELYKKLAAQSKGNYDKVAERFIYNRELLNKSPYQQYFCSASGCGNEGLLQCEETSLIYCSIKCSFITDEEEDFSSLSTIAQGQQLKLNDKVVICGIINEKCVYVRHRDSDFGSLQNDIYKLGKKAPQLEEFPQVGDFVLVKNFGETCRAKVLNISDDEDYAISLQLVDYGSTTNVFFGDLMAMSQALLKLECITHKLLLKDVKIDAIHRQIIDYMLKLQTDKAELTITDLNGYEAVLVEKPLTITVNQNIMSLSAVVAISFDNNQGVYLSDYPYIDSFCSKTLQKLFVVSTASNDPSYFFCILEEDLKDFLELYKAINVFGNNRKSEAVGIPLNEGQVCLMFVNGQWHRGTVEKTEGDGFPLCVLLDQNVFQNIAVSNIIPMPNAFKLPPPTVEFCKIDNFENETVKQIASETIKAGKLVAVKGMKRDEDCIIVTIA